MKNGLSALAMLGRAAAPEGAVWALNGRARGNCKSQCQGRRSGHVYTGGLFAVEGEKRNAGA